jgi:hypothetical protein
MMNRRNFVARAATGAGALLLTSFTTACWFTGTVFTQIMAYVGVGLTAFQAVVDLLVPGSAPGIDLAVALVKAGFADLQLAVQDYNNAPAANKSTLLGKISTALAALQNEIQGFWSNLHLPDSSLAKLIKGLLGIILSTLAGFAGQLPAPPAGTKLMAIPDNAMPVVPKVRTKKQFEQDFNNALKEAGRETVRFS